MSAHGVVQVAQGMGKIYALAYPTYASLDDLEAVRLHRRQHTQQSIRWRWQGTMPIHAETASRPRRASTALRRHMRLESGLKGWDEDRKLAAGQTGHIEERRRTPLHVRALYICH